MRYRLKDYKITIEGNNVDVHFNVPEGDDWMVANPVKEAIRLIVDETAGIVFCSSIQKDKIIGCSSSSETGYNWKARFAIPTGKTVSVYDKFTVEMDFGEAPRDLATSAEVEVIGDKVGAKDSSDASEPSTLFAWFRRLYQNIQSVLSSVYNAQNTKSAVSEAASANTKLGGKDDSADDSTNGSVFARLRAIINKIGTNADQASELSGGGTIFGRLRAIIDNYLDNSQYGLGKIYTDAAKETAATTNKQAVMQHVSDTFVKVAYTEANVMPVCADDYGCLYEGQYYILQDDETASHGSDYQIGDIIKCTGRGTGVHSNVIFSSISAQPNHQNPDVTQVVGSHIVWQPGHYYRIKDIVSVNDGGGQYSDVIDFFVYEELPASIVEWFDQTKEAVQAAKQAIKGSDAAATLTAIYAHLNGGGSLPADVQQQLTLILNYLGSPAAMSCEGMTPQEVVDELEDIFGIMGLDIAPCSVDSDGNVTAPSES